jgi:hypothetical protein
MSGHSSKDDFPLDPDFGEKFFEDGPLTEMEAALARDVLGISEQKVEKLARHSGKMWLRKNGVKYPEEWE